MAFITIGIFIASRTVADIISGPFKLLKGIFHPFLSCSQKCLPPVLGFDGCIGNTPMIELRGLSQITGCRILAKAEFLNPGGSPKDRVALQIINEAESGGILQKGGCIVEGTAGSTGISLSLLACARGYGCKIVMADDMSREKSDLLECYGAEVIRVPAVSIVNNGHFCKRAASLADELPGGFFANQFENTANFRAHFSTTGPEIWSQTQGNIDAFVMGAGTGGTIGGVGAYLRSCNDNIRVCLIDPPGSALYYKVTNGVMYTPELSERRLQRNRYDTITEGIGIDRMTANLSLALPHITDAFKGTDQEAVTMAQYLLHKEGLFLGSSSAMNCVGAVKMARKLGPGHTIVTVLCDSGQRALSKLYNEDFLQKRGLNLPKSIDSSLDFVS
eukprot:m.143427 g.143427  ORF g.143427 m.143427 type:complete len:389 (-) comp14896_c0_seq4:28-1194(-)